MSWGPSINEICERALRKIGALAIRSSGARQGEMDEARYWLDMHVGHIAGTKRTWWAVPRTATFALTPGTTEYNLASVLGAKAPNGVEFAIGLWLLDATGANLHEIKILRRQEWEALTPDPTSGEPVYCYINRDQAPTLFLPNVPTTQAYSVKFLFQSYAPNIVSKRGLERVTTFRSSYTLYLVTQLSALIADGPVRKLPKDEVDSMYSRAATLWRDIESYEDQEQNNEPARVTFYNGI